MITTVYGRAFAPFVAPVARYLRDAAAAAGGSIAAVTIEQAIANPDWCADVHRVYVLPFDPPATSPLPRGTDRPAAPAALVRAAFPRAEVANSFAVQDLCWDKVATQERLLERGIPVPDTLVSVDPTEVVDFVRRHGFAVLKERHSCGGQGHVVVWFEDGLLVGDCGSRQCRIDLVADGMRHLEAERLIYPGPFYVQRLVTDVSLRVRTPAQVLRAYVVDNHVVFWTERYRDRYIRPADWILNVARGAKYRFVQSVSEEAKKIALRTAEVIGMRIGAVDMVRAGSIGPYVIEADTDGYHMIIDRQFKDIPEYREFFNLDRYIAEALLLEPLAYTSRPDRRFNSR
jgi:glutathione synthase/RimK-type ligase-like ATP-grasp enzyme